MIERYISSYEENFEKENSYACPICLKEFSMKGIGLPPDLTREHVPPHSLGGTVKCYTCARCNNTFGAKADSNLLLGIQLNKDVFFKNLKDQKVRVTSEDGQVFQGQISANEDGTLTMYHSKKNNHPIKLEDFIGTVVTGQILNFNPVLPQVNLHLLNVGLLKSAYLLVFEKLGYKVVASVAYDVVRNQLMNPDDNIYFENTILRGAFTAKQEGVYFAEMDGNKFICVVITLRYLQNEITFGVKMPDLDSTNSLLNSISYISACFSFSKECPVNTLCYFDNLAAKQYNERLKCTFTPILLS